MATCLLLPVGITRETVEGLLRHEDVGQLDCVVAVTTVGFEREKREIVEAIKAIAEMVGASFHYLVVEPWSEDASARIYSILAKERPRRIIVSGVTGSRYLQPIIVQAVLRYWRDTGAEAYLVHGVEGEGWRLEPLVGYYTYKLNRQQLRVFQLVYSHSGGALRTKKDLIERYGFTRSVYKVLRELERKGLIRHRRNRIEKTFPGRLLYNLLKESGAIKG